VPQQSEPSEGKGNARGVERRGGDGKMGWMDGKSKKGSARDDSGQHSRARDA